jgi:carbamoyltransferase
MTDGTARSETRKILGISAYFHDSSAALVYGGELVAAAEERFTRLKHDSNFPHHAIQFCLDQAGVTAQELDAVVFYEEPHVKLTRVLSSTIAGFPASRPFFVNAIKQWLGGKLWTHNEISAALDIHPDKVRLVPHHLSHAAQAFCASPFDEAAILTMDAVGEWTCSAISHGRRGNQGHGVTLETLVSIPYPHSLGLVYAAFSAFLGFRPNDGEASTMALAAFGQPRFAAAVRRVLRVEPDGTYTVDDRMFRFLSSDTDLFTPAFLDLFGQPRDFRKPLPFDSLDDHFGSREVTADDQRFADIAASLQTVLGEAVLALADCAHRVTGCDNLCLAGGIALNAVVNTAVIEGSKPGEVFIPSDPGDGGAAVGAALAEYYRQTNGDGRRFSWTPYLGKSFEDSVQDLRTIIEEVDPANWSEYLMDGCSGITRDELEWEDFGSFESLAASIAAELDAGRIVGWLQGRFELGPRALGNRSILVDPQNLSAVRRLSAKVKSRAAFRPYALAVREEDAAEVFDFEGPIPHCARWMQMVKRARPEAEARVRGALHIDRTSRLQVCSAEANPKFHGLLTAFAARRGLGALLNTSFNDSGYPIVASPSEALLTLARTELDILVVHQLVIRKKRP